MRRVYTKKPREAVKRNGRMLFVYGNFALGFSIALDLSTNVESSASGTRFDGMNMISEVKKKNVLRAIFSKLLL